MLLFNFSIVEGHTNYELTYFPGLHHLRLLQRSKTKADQQLRLENEGDEPRTASYSPTPSAGKNAQWETSISSICLSTPNPVRNGKSKTMVTIETVLSKQHLDSLPSPVCLFLSPSRLAVEAV